MIRTFALKELRSIFSAPSTWVISGLLQFVISWSFLVRLDNFLQIQSKLSLASNAPGATQVIIPPLFSTIALLMMILTPVFTMRLLAEERRNQTMPLLLAAPVSPLQIVIGKYLGLLTFLTLLICCYATMMLVLAAGTPLDFGLLLANAIGLLLLTACYAALGLYISSLTAHPIVAITGAIAISFCLWLLDVSAADNTRIWHALTPTGHFQEFNGGLLSSSGVAYYLLSCVFFLLLAIRRIHSNRIYG